MSTNFQKSNFQKIFEFNNAFGVKTAKNPEEAFQDTKMIKYRLDLIIEEVEELKEALKNNDKKETIDALADILYVVYGCGSSLGIDLDKAFDIVHQSNMSKLCPTEEIAKETVEWYKANEKRYDSPAYRKSNDGKYWVVYNESSGKILKNKYYKAASFEEM